jgi:phage tail-like protein
MRFRFKSSSAFRFRTATSPSRLSKSSASMPSTLPPAWKRRFNTSYACCSRRLSARKRQSPRRTKAARRGEIQQHCAKRGMTSDLSLWNWMRETLESQVSRRNMSVVLLNEAGEEVIRFNFRDAWPAKWSGPDLNGEGNGVAIETLEIAHEGLSIAS